MNDVRIARSSVTLEELEKFLKLLPTVLTTEQILQSWQEGAEDQVISAKALSEVLKVLNQRSEGTGLVTQIQDAPDCNVLTDELKDKLDNFSLRFVGVLADVLQRDNIDVSNYIGGETIILLRNEYGNASIQYYDKPLTSWRDLYPVQAGERTVEVETPQNALVRTFVKANYRMIRVNVLAKTSDKVQSTVATISYTTGSSVANIGIEHEHIPQGRLFTLRASAADPTIEVRAETSASNTSVRVIFLGGI